MTQIEIFKVSVAKSEAPLSSLPTVWNATVGEMDLPQPVPSAFEACLYPGKTWVPCGFW